MERAAAVSGAGWTAGGCHCGEVRFEVRVPAGAVLHDCNCSICTASGYLHLIVEAAGFRLLTGPERLVEYRFGTRTARHLFCGRCGVKSFYVPRSHPDGYSVNARCLDGVDLSAFRIEPFDGREWEAARASMDGP